MADRDLDQDHLIQSRLKSPAWYGLPVALFLFLSFGDPLVLARIPPIDSVSAWLLQQDHLKGETPFQSVAKALSFVLLPIQFLGLNWVLWPLRGRSVYLDERRQPPAMLELACILFLAGGVYAHYFLNSGTGCARCPRDTFGVAAMEACVLFTLPFVLYGLLQTIYTRLVLISIK